MLQSMLHCVIRVRGLKLNIRGLQDCCNRCRYLSGSGKKLVWRGFDSIWVIVDRLTKVAHFIPVRTTYSSAKLVELYLEMIVSLHGVPNKIVSDRGTQFTSYCWQKV
jgi:hypothetical protein